MRGYESALFITDRIPKQSVIEVQQKSDLLLMISHKGIKGIPSSKMYEYIGLKKSILLYPNDNDIIEATLLDSKLGLICENKKQILDCLIDLMEKKKIGGSLQIEVDQSKIDFYSRKSQTKELVNLIEQIS